MLKKLFYGLFVRPLVLLVIGLNVTDRHLFPKQGPAIIVANHNSHLDTLVLSSLFPLKLLPKVRPVAAADYFLKNKIMAWVALKIIGIIPIKRAKADRTLKDPFQESYEALEQGNILILFPEGSRGDPEKMGAFKNGIARLASKYPEVPVHPIYLQGLGKALPKGEGLFVPFFCDIFLTDPIYFKNSKQEFMENLGRVFAALEGRHKKKTWEDFNF